MTINNKSTINYEKRRFSDVEIGETFISEEEDFGYGDSTNLFVKTGEYLLKDCPTCKPRNAYSFNEEEMVHFEEDEIVVMVTTEVNFTLNSVSFINGRKK